jgi:hypothetical protein
MDPFSAPSIAFGDNTSSDTPPFHPSAEPVRTKRKPIPRKGHKKSRKGCFACKKRKVKCTEQLPQCAQCERLDLDCEYPTMRYQKANEKTAVTTTTQRTGPLMPAPTNALRTTSTTFSMDDMRFFSHFLLTAYPSLPLNGDQIWSTVAPEFFVTVLGCVRSHQESVSRVVCLATWLPRAATATAPKTDSWRLLRRS